MPRNVPCKKAWEGVFRHVSLLQRKAKPKAKPVAPLHFAPCLGQPDPWNKQTTVWCVGWSQLVGAEGQTGEKPAMIDGWAFLVFAWRNEVAMRGGRMSENLRLLAQLMLSAVALQRLAREMNLGEHEGGERSPWET